MTAQQSADQTTPLRDRIAAALYDHSHPGWALSFPDLDQDQRDTYLARADAVLAVLPAPVDRRAVLREAADRIDRTELPQDDVDCFDNGARWATKLLRRMADETAATETPWPTRQRWRVELFDYLAEEWAPGTSWPTREQATERYELMKAKAPTWKDGTPVRRRVVRETTTYTVEADTEPAAGARQDGAQP
ncbi:hypothetical protein [Streptomyces sp. RK76]|uniref:hypothetical protein n=1 Tax=Streptomyces sp. RK76 TaxID=2824896 RepID=UPI001B37B2D1|nr:hypothetical protein [Streptomyces sp. RK76]MBQ0947675.1 hypothetical protein [Streptomyces sp. RK76]